MERNDEDDIPYKDLDNTSRFYACAHDHMMELFENGKHKESIQLAEKTLTVGPLFPDAIRSVD